MAKPVPAEARHLFDGKGADGLRVLIVDDDQFLAETLAEILAEESIDVATVRTGAHALDEVRGHPNGIALIDVRLPDIGGIELMRRMREIAPDLDIVIVTGNASVHSAIEALNQGASRYILKPCAPDELLSIVHDLWERQQLRERTRLYLRRLEVQNSLSDALSSALLPEDAARASVEAIRSLAEVQAAVVLMHQEGADAGGDRARLKPLAWAGVEQRTAESLAAMTEVAAYLSHAAVAGGTPGTVGIRAAEASSKGEICPVSLYRLRGRTTDLGVLAVMASCDWAMDEHHEDLLNAIANWVGVALERAMLYRRLEVAYSDLKNAQRRLIQAEKLSAIGRLGAGLAHEVGTPLNIISGRAEYLMELVGDDPRTKQGLNVIVQQIDRISRLIRQLLDFSREYSPVRTRIDLSAVLTAVVPLLEVPLGKAKIDLAARLPEGLPKVMANFNQMQQVFINLLMNSIDAITADPGHLAGKGRGTIAVTAELVPRTHKVHVRVSDNGHGILEENLDKVFDPFFSTKDVGAGTGLGLAVVYGIITEHGGSIEVDSGWNQGTTVSFSLPAETG